MNTQMKKWMQLAFGIFLIWFFVFVAIPFMISLDIAQPIVNEIHEKGIEADALFYTESPIALEAAYKLEKMH